MQLIWQLVYMLKSKAAGSVDDLQWLEEVIYMHRFRSHKNGHQGPLLLTWINFNPSMDKLSHAQ